MARLWTREGISRRMTEETSPILPSARSGVASAGPVDSSVGQLFTRGAKVLTASRELADVVIVEVPPLLAFHDGEALSRASDIVLLVGECGTTTFDQAKGAGEILRRSGAPVLGVILTNAVPAHRGKGKSEPYRGSRPGSRPGRTGWRPSPGPSELARQVPARGRSNRGKSAFPSAHTYLTRRVCEGESVGGEPPAQSQIGGLCLAERWRSGMSL